MAFENFLSQLVPPGEQMIPGMGGLEQALARNQMLGQQQQMMQRQRPQRPGIMDILGTLGDAILAGKGRQPIYGAFKQQQQRRQMGGDIANYLGDTDGALSQIMQADPETGVALWKMTHPQEKVADTPSAVREWEYYHGLPQEQQGDYRKFRRISRPQIIGSAATGYGIYDPEADGEDAPIGEAPTVNSQEEYDALPPGTHYRDSQGNIGLKGGGPTAGPSGGFPGQ